MKVDLSVRQMGMLVKMRPVLVSLALLFGSVALSSSAAGLPGITSNTFTIVAGSSSKLAFTTQPPSTGTAGQAFSVTVQVQDANGNIVAGSNAQITVNSTPPGMSGTTTLTAINGVAVFTDLVMNTAGSYSLTAASSGLTNATSTSITIGATTASQLVFTAQPASGTAGQALTPAVMVTIEDNFGNVVASNGQVSIASTPAGVSGITTMTAVNGVATFNKLVLNTANNYTLTSSAAGLPGITSNTFTIVAGSSSKLAFTTQPPSTGTAGQAFSVTVQVQDANGNIVAGSNAQITVNSTPPGMSGTTTLTAINGVAMFTDLVMNTAGSYALTATSSGLTNATSTSITIGAATASQLLFTTQPASGTAGQALTPAVMVTIEDNFGNVVASNGQVSIASTPAGVSGITTMTAVNGVATFNNLGLNTANKYKLTSHAAGLPGITSNTFTIVAGSSSKLAFTTQPPSTGTAGQAFSVTVQVQDANGNIVAGSNAQITVNSTPPGMSGTP